MRTGTTSGPGRSSRRSLWLMVFTALALRVARVLLARSYFIPLVHVRPPMSIADPHYGFGFEIGSIAHSLATGHGFGSPFGLLTGPTAWIAPVYPFLCTVVFKVFGLFTPASAFVILFMNGVFAALTCIPLYRICEIMIGPGAGLCAGWAWTVFPYFWSWPTSEIWETSLVALLLTCLVLAVLELADAANYQNRMKWVQFGMLWGLALLTNPVLLTFLPISLVWIAHRLCRDKANFYRSASIAVGVCFLAVAPWLIRNRVVFGQFVFIRSNFGFEFHLGNYHLSNGYGWAGKHPSANKAEREEYNRIGEIAYVSAKRDDAIRFVRQYPREFLALTLNRIYAFWSGGMIPYGGGPLLPWFYGPFSVLTLFGWLLAVRDNIEGQGLLLGLLLLFPLPFYIAFPQARNRHAIEPEMLALSVYFVVAGLRELRGKRGQTHLGACPAEFQEADRK